MLLRLDLPKLVIAIGSEGVDTAVAAAAAAAAATTTGATAAAGGAARRGCSRLQEGTLLRVSLQAARHRLALYDRARGWEACSVGRLSAEVLELSDLTLEPLVSQAEFRLRLGKVSAAAPTGPADTAGAGAQPSAPLRASLDCGNVAVHVGPASIQLACLLHALMP